MLRRIAQLSIRRRRLVLIGALIVFVVSGAIGGGVADRLSSGGFEDPSAESTRADDLLGEAFDTGTPNIILVVTATGGDVDAADAAAAGREVAAELGA
ncbi:MAG: hypothetical protein KDA97_15255, partial [Acidimicrobiales bacterium]|nr:hypothetical protein [Acidimicrobiales bacterium]